MEMKKQKMELVEDIGSDLDWFVTETPENARMYKIVEEAEVKKEDEVKNEDEEKKEAEVKKEDEVKKEAEEKKEDGKEEGGKEEDDTKEEKYELTKVEDGGVTYYIPRIEFMIDRYDSEKCMVDVDKDMTLTQIVQFVYDFYQKPIAKEHLTDEVKKEYEELFGKNHKLEIYLDFLTSTRKCGRGSGDKESDMETRDPLWHCNGAIRFEALALQQDEDDNPFYSLCLGS